MTRGELIWPYVEKVLAELLGAEQLSRLDDQVVALRAGSTSVIIRMLDSDEPRLQVFAPVLRDVEKSADLLERLNELNAIIPFAKAFWQDGEVLIATELLAEGLEKESISAAIGTIATAADHFDDELKARFGGETAFPDTGHASRAGTPTLRGMGEGIGAPPGVEAGEPPEVIAAPSTGVDAGNRDEREPESPGYL